jgi:hypothetical protein
MVRRGMEFGVEFTMIACPRIRTSDNAPLAPAILGADAVAKLGQRNENVRLALLGKPQHCG